MRVELVAAPRAVGGSRRAPVRAAPYPEASPALARAEIRETAAFRAAVPFIRSPQRRNGALYPLRRAGRRKVGRVPTNFVTGPRRAHRVAIKRGGACGHR